MITCKDCITFLMAYLDGELPAEQRAQFEKHLKACPPCVEYVESYKQTTKLAGACGCSGKGSTAGVPEGLVKAIMQAMKTGKGCGGEGSTGA